MSGPRVFRRVLVANRGEIACRVITTCRRLGIETVLTVSDADAASLPARLADKVIRIGPAPAADSYLNVDAVVGAALAAGVDAIHPGYGFLSENARLAAACAAAGIVFIGPAPETLEATGDKLAARERATAAGLPVLPGGHVGLTAYPALPPNPGRRTPATPASREASGTAARDSRPKAREPDGDPFAALAAAIGYPVLVKAAGGGGGRGLRVVHDPAELADAVAVASAEAGAAFGDPRVYLERYVERGRHVEVQILGDGERVIHLGDRDCSVQRRYQKLIEEAPAPGLDDDLRERLRAAAVTLGRQLRYAGAGTVEFLVDVDRGEFYFLEVNARIQVEHPVTEAISGLDIVAEQIAIAEGRPLRLRQEDVTFAGHAIECRINAEDPAHDFRPSPGTVSRAVFPVGPASRNLGCGEDAGSEGGGRVAGYVRVDTHVQAGATVPPYYDSLLAKVIAHGADRDDALAALRTALDRCVIDGVTTNVGLQRAVIAATGFAAGGVDTGYLARWLTDGGLAHADGNLAATDGTTDLDADRGRAATDVYPNLDADGGRAASDADGADGD
ncbi:MAG: biotin carboxylase N-terminal domain-containing protein [Trebonia sp.]